MTNTERRRRAAKEPFDHDPHRLRQARIQRGMGLVQTAEKAGISRGTLSELERGTRNASPITLAKIAGALDCDVAELLAEPVRAA